MLSYTLNGCAPEFALWSFVDLGYLTYYTTYMLATAPVMIPAGKQVAAVTLPNNPDIHVFAVAAG